MAAVAAFFGVLKGSSGISLTPDILFVPLRETSCATPPVVLFAAVFMSWGVLAYSFSVGVYAV